MDPITHAASGALAMLALPSRPATRWAVPLAALAAAAPDIDVIFGWSPLLALQTHRGFTHALALAPLWALLLALLMVPLWRRRQSDFTAQAAARKRDVTAEARLHEQEETATVHTNESASLPPCCNAAPAPLWRFRTVWLFAMGMLVLHIWLDAVTTYGTLALLPFSDFRVRGNAIFIVDVFLTLPLLAALLLRHRPAVVLAGLLWVFFYPAGMIAVHEWHTIQANQAVRHAENQVLPDVLAPLYWRVLSQRDGVVHAYSMDWRGRLEEKDSPLSAAPAGLMNTLAAQDASCLAFQRFALLPVLRREEAQGREAAPGDNVQGREGEHRNEGQQGEDGAWLLYDLRFGSSLAWARRLMQPFIRQPSPFLLRVRLRPDGTVQAVRMNYAAKDSGWQAPRAPQPQGAGMALGLY